MSARTKVLLGAVLTLVFGGVATVGAINGAVVQILVLFNIGFFGMWMVTRYNACGIILAVPLVAVAALVGLVVWDAMALPVIADHETLNRGLYRMLGMLGGMLLGFGLGALVWQVKETLVGGRRT